MTSRWLVLAGCLWVPLPVSAADVDYVRDVKPILKERCYACHGALKQQSELRLDSGALILKGGSGGPGVVAGDVEGSLLLEKVTAGEGERMPPEGTPLTTEQIATLKAWVANGAKYPETDMPEVDPRDHWAFRPPVKPVLPVLAGDAWSRNDIDVLLHAKHRELGLTPVGPADKATLLRRVHIDLIGLPPTREELHAFLSDERPDAYERVVDALLDRPQHGERWARHWMDVWRYSDWYGRRSVPDVMNSYPQIWRWRDWIVRSLNEDRGYDWMVARMLAADEIDPENDADVVATGFIARNFFKWNYNQWMRDQVEHTGKAFLGLTFNCAHCHDHKYDPISQEDYFRFRAFFEPLEMRHDRVAGEADPGPFQKYIYAKSYGPIATGAIRVFDEKPEVPTVMYEKGDERKKMEGRPPVTAGMPDSLGGDTLKVEPVSLPGAAWYPGLKPFVQEEELAKVRNELAVAESALASAKKAAEPVVGESKRDVALTVAEANFAAAQAVLAWTEARIAGDQARYGVARPDAQALIQTAAKAEQQVAVARARAGLAGAEKAAVDAEALPQSTGDAAKDAAHKKTRDAAQAQLAAARTALTAAEAALAKDVTDYTPFSPKYPATSTGRRKALAEWLTRRDNPLAARVAVNHLWSWHFGRPLVESTFNFGRSGKTPSNPELLDWLAVDLMDHGWQMKRLHRLIVTSEAYRMSSRAAEPQTERLHSQSFSPQRGEQVPDRAEEGGQRLAALLTLSALGSPVAHTPFALISHPLTRPSATLSPFRGERDLALAVLLTPARSNVDIDPDNRHLWRFNPERIEAEVVRDSLLSVAGELEVAIGGKELDQSLGLTARRRSLYFAHHGEERMKFLELFDVASATDCYERTSSVTPQQALALSNSELTQMLGKAFAKRLAAACPGDADFVTAAFEQILTRPPTAGEVELSQRFLQKQATAGDATRARESFIQALLNHNDFVTVR